MKMNNSYLNNTDEYHNNPEQKKSQTSYSSHTKFFKSQNRYYIEIHL